ncbi:hypothetical protein D5S17_07745 [Pseudonocardiaceae bacterium YIM PH 21723]|nr:hypothetical protein D5S17_07745 [Pseudonocardiaceae bacterium YIM PH 21723]
MGAVRPNPAQWLWYAVGGRLPARFKEWVLRDVTCRSWGWRHAGRATLLIAPLALGILLLPLPLEIRGCMAGLSAIVGYYFSFSYLEESCEVRASKHGHPYGAAAMVRQAADAEANAEAHARYIARYRQTESPQEQTN